MSEYFLLPPLTLQEMIHLGLGDICESSWGADGRIFPQLAVMPMGWSWAIYFAQHAHSRMIQKFSNAETEDFLEMGRPASSLSADRPGAHAYCDNLGMFGTDPQGAQQWTDQIVDGIGSSGFEVLEREEASVYAATVGVEINGLKGTQSAKPRRLWRLRVTLRWLSTADGLGDNNWSVSSDTWFSALCSTGPAWRFPGTSTTSSEPVIGTGAGYGGVPRWSVQRRPLFCRSPGPT